MSNRNVAENLNADQLSSILSLRAQVYSIIRHLFLFEPSREYLQNILQHKVLKVISEAYPEEHLRTSSLNFLNAVKELLEEGDERLIDTWAEYTRLFIGPAPPIASPYESIQRPVEKGRGYKGEAWLDVREWLLEDGLILEDHSVLEDHAGIEFEYMMLTTIKANSLLQQGMIDDSLKVLARQKKFLEEHITKWVPKLCSEIEAHSKSYFYRSLAKFTTDFLKEDLDLLNELLSSFVKSVETEDSNM